MAKYDVTYACGHTVTEQLYGPEKDRQRRIEWVRENRLCTECYRAKRRAEAEANAVAQDLPALTGSAKQVAWAVTLRDKALAEIDALIEEALYPLTHTAEECEAWNREHRFTTTLRMRPVEMDADEAKRLIASYAAIRAAVATETEAHYWIDHRHDSARKHLARHRDAVPELAAAADRAAAERAAKREAEDQARAREETRHSAEREAEAARRAEQAREDAEEQFEAEEIARGFRVVDARVEGRVEYEGRLVGGRLVVTAQDGAVATGWDDEGEWFVVEVAARKIDSLSPEAERIARDATALLQQTV